MNQKNLLLIAIIFLIMPGCYGIRDKNEYAENEFGVTEIECGVPNAPQALMVKSKG
ncbi:MAG: hypothetical protein JXR67_04975 [Bacteroidales bacterium]|nr:hypothetical protein [Bacteroidales bacterium]